MYSQDRGMEKSVTLITLGGFWGQNGGIRPKGMVTEKVCANRKFLQGGKCFVVASLKPQYRNDSFKFTHFPKFSFHILLFFPSFTLCVPVSCHSH